MAFPKAMFMKLTVAQQYYMETSFTEINQNRS